MSFGKTEVMSECNVIIFINEKKFILLFVRFVLIFVFVFVFVDRDLDEALEMGMDWSLREG